MNKPILIKEFIKDKRVASIKSSSRFTAKDICDKINFSRDLVIVEYGPGNGIITKEILRRMNTNSKIIVIETNKKLSLFLGKIRDKRLISINDSAENIESILKKLKIKEADYVISGIPFSMIKQNTKNIILNKTRKILSENGKFIVYQFKKDIEKDLERYFKIKSKKFEIRNIPPLVIFECETFD